MYHPRLLSLNSPLSPIPPMKKFDFSSNANMRAQSSKSLCLPSSTPEMFHIASPNVSPIKRANSSMHQFDSPNKLGNTSPMQQLNVSNAPVDIGLDFNRKMELLSFENLVDDDDDSFNKSNINNRHLNVSTILDDLGLKQYKTLFSMQEIDLMAFFLLTDEDFQTLGITNEKHREILKRAVNTFCGF